MYILIFVKYFILIIMFYLTFKCNITVQSFMFFLTENLFHMDNTKSNGTRPCLKQKRSVFGIPFFPLLILCISFSFMAGRAEARHGIHIPRHAIEGFITKCSENYTLSGCSAMGEVYENSGKVDKALRIYKNHCMKNNDAHSCVLAAEVLKEHLTMLVLTAFTKNWHLKYNQD